jgi:hypothetical protein
MHAFAQKRKPTQQVKSAKSTKYWRAFCGQNHASPPILRSQDQGVQRLPRSNAKEVAVNFFTTPSTRAGQNRVPMVSEDAPSRRGNFFISLTTGNDDEGMFQTAVGDQDTAFTNSFNTQFPGLGGSTPGPIVGSPLAGSHPCVPTVVRSSLPSGHIAARVSGGRFAAPFSMAADFETPIPCNGRCGEYRQLVSGYSQLNGTDIVHPLCSNNVSRTTEYEDCFSSGSTTLKYGYHSIPYGNSRFANPDQATGWSYQGRDRPGFNLASLPSGTVLNFNLSFRGELVDACDGDRPLQTSATWTVGGSHTVP